MEALRLLTKNQTGTDYDAEVERLLSCPICLEVYSKPVVILPCQHNLCRKCANDVFQNRGTPMGSGGRFRCPTCRYEVMLDRHGVYGLQRNLLVENIIDMYQSESKKPFRKMEVLMCEEHEEEKVNIFCITCQKPTCSLCKVFGQHQECTVSTVDKVYKEHKTEVSTAIAMLVAGNDKLQSVISKTEELTTKTEENSKTAQSDLSAAFDRLYSILEDRKQSMIGKIKAATQEKVEILQEMLKDYGIRLEGSSKLVEEALALLEEPNAPQFLSVSRELINRVTSTASASDVKKPSGDIHRMDIFKVDFEPHETSLCKINFPNAEDNLDDECDVDDCEFTDETSATSDETPRSSTDVGFRAKLMLPKQEESEVVAAAEVTANKTRLDTDSDDSPSRSDVEIDAIGRRDSFTSVEECQLDSDVKAIAERYLNGRASRCASQPSARSGSAMSSDARRYSEEDRKSAVGNSAIGSRYRMFRSFSPENMDQSPLTFTPRHVNRSTAFFLPGQYPGSQSPSNGNSKNSSRSSSPVPDSSRTLLSGILRRRGSGNHITQLDESPDRSALSSSQVSTEPTATNHNRCTTRRTLRMYATHRRRTWSHLLEKKN